MEFKKMKEKEMLLTNQVMEFQKEVNRLKKEISEITASYFIMASERDKYLEYALTLEKYVTEHNISITD